MRRPVLVTGAGGFVGGHLMAALGARGHASATDVRDPDALRATISALRPDAVVHLAALSSVAASWGSGGEVWEANAVGTVNLLDAVRAEAPTARVIVVSTAEVYGTAACLPTPEESPLAPLSPYAASKLAAEVAADRARRVDGLDVVTVRPFMHEGPGRDERFAIASWTAQIARLERAGGGTVLVGNLTARRDILDVRDVCRAYIGLLDRAVPGSTYNVASGVTHSMREVLDMLLTQARVPVTTAADPARQRAADVAILHGDADRLRAQTGWEPAIPLERTLADVLAAARAANPERSHP